MAEQKDSQATEVGISALPKSWALVVQLVGTFGLAVFLVVYYVLKMQPDEVARYEQLQKSVATLGEIIAGQQSLITREQQVGLEDLYVTAMAHEVAQLLVIDLRGTPTPDALAAKVEDKLIFNTRLLEGLRRKDGGTVSEMLTHKIRNSGISKEIAARAIAEWKDASEDSLARGCREMLDFAIKRAAMAK